MPHLVLEYSANVPEDPDLPALLAHLHEAMAATGFDESRIKSRAVRRESFRVADGAPDRAFVHLTVSVLAGREASVLHRTAQTLLAVVTAGFPRAQAERRCDVTLEIREMRPDLYLKADASPEHPAGRREPR